MSMSTNFLKGQHLSGLVKYDNDLTE